MAKVFCFSATGNSLYVAKNIAKEINGEVFSMKEKVSVDDDVIGFVFPTYFWGLPVTVGRFLDKIDFQNKNAYIFVVTTYGSFSAGVGNLADKRLNKKGVSVSYENKIRMTENYLPSFKVNESDRLWDSADKKISKIVSDIKIRKVKKSHFFIPFDKILYDFYPALKKGHTEKFSVHDCKSCHICEKVCPNNNIKFENGTPIRENKCDFCLACIHACPYDAIEYDEKTQGKKRYKNSRISVDEIIKLNNTEERK